MKPSERLISGYFFFFKFKWSFCVCETGRRTLEEIYSCVKPSANIFRKNFFFCWHFSNLSEKLREHFYRFLFQGRQTFPRNFSRMFLLMLIIPLKFTKELFFFFLHVWNLAKTEKHNSVAYLFSSYFRLQKNQKSNSRWFFFVKLLVKIFFIRIYF